MPGPHPEGIYFEEYDGRIIVSYYRYFWSGNVGNRKARAIAILRRLVRHNWKCSWCRETLPEWRRADVQFCRESCRKRAARWQRNRRGEQ